MKQSLLLWDIDGTLVNTDRAGERSLIALLRDLYAREFGGDLPAIEVQGCTDTKIMLDLLALIGQSATDAEIARFRAAYLGGLATVLPLGRARVLPGVNEVLKTVESHPAVHQALLTGNLREGARLKLSHLNLWNYFQFGAFADDRADRNELGPVALARARQKLGINFSPGQVWIIGDTPRDIACGKVIGAKTIAVATGSYSLAELEKHAPTCVLPDLSETDALLRLVLADTTLSM